MKKEKIKTLPIIKNLVKIFKSIKITREFYLDNKFFIKNYVYSKPDSINKISYDLIRITHSVEKGLSSLNPRIFGTNATNSLMELIKKYDSISKEPNFSYNMALTVLDNFLIFYEAHDWQSEEQYLKVKKFMREYVTHLTTDAGMVEINNLELLQGTNFDYAEFLSSRHSVRNFAEKPVEANIIKDCVKIAMKTPSACNRQMIKIYNCQNKHTINYITEIAQGVGGFEVDNLSYLVVTYDTNSLYFVGERNQGYFNAGLFSMNLVNILHSKGIGSCFIQFGNSFKEEEDMKKQLDIGKGERIAVLIAYGYYAKTSKIPKSTRKNVDEIYNNR